MPHANHPSNLRAIVQSSVVASGPATPGRRAGSRRRALSLGMAALCTTVGAHAASNTWKGTVDLNWDAFTSNWDSPSVWVNDDDAIFSGTGGAINVGAVSAHNLSFTANGYTFAGSPLTLNGSVPTIDVSAGISTSFANILTGTAGLQKSGTGTVILTGANSYVGGTVINAGTVQIGNATSNGTIGTGTYSIASGATLYLNYATAASPTWANITGEGTLRLNSAQAINGSANWSTAAMAIPATFLGTLQVDRGRINAPPSTLGGTTNLVIGDGAQFLAFDGSTSGASYTYPQNVSIKGLGWGEGGQNLGALRVSGMNATFPGNITLTGSAGLYTQSGVSTMTVTGPISDGGAGYALTTNAAGTTTITLSNTGNNYTGDTLIATGRLKLGASGVIPDGPGKGNVSVTGTLDLNTFSETINGLTGNGTVDNVAGAGAPVLTVGTNDATSTFGGVIKNTTGTLILTKTGTGTLTLGGASTYSGVTNVNNGTLLLNNGSLNAAGSVAVGGAGVTFGGKGSAGSVTVSAGGTLQGGLANTGSLALASLTFSGNSPLSIQPAAGATASVAVSGAITTSGTQTINITGSPLKTGSYRLLSFGSIVGNGLTAIVLGSTPQPPGARPRAYTLDTTTSPTDVGLNVLADGAIWSGAVNGAWDTTTANWKLASDGTTATTYFNADDVQFNDTPGNRNVAISGADVTPTTLLFNNSTGNDYTISGNNGIAGVTSLVKNGAGKLTLTNTNSYTGGTTISAGTLEFGDGTTNGVIAGNIANAASLIFNNASAQSFAGVISGAGTLTKIGAGTLTLSAANSYTGATAFNSGVLSVGTLAPNGTNSGIGAGTALTFDGGTLRYTGGNVGNDTLTTQFNRAITVNAGGGTIDVAGSGFVFHNGAFTGSGTLNVVDISGDANNRQLLVTGNSPAFSGNLRIGNGSPNSGWVQYRSNAASPFGSGTITINGGGILSADNGATIPTTLSNAIVLNGGTLQGQTAKVRYNGPITAAAGTTSFLVPAPATDLEIGGNISGSGNITETTGAFSVRLLGDNSGYTGTYLHAGTGATIFDSINAGSASASWTINVAAGRYLSNVAGTPTIHMGALSGTAGFLANLMNNSTATFSVGALNTDTTFAGSINNAVSSNGITALTKVGTGTLTLSGPGAIPTSNSAFSGDITINGGKLVGAAVRTGSNTVFGLASSARTITVNAGTTLEFQAPNTFGNHNVINVPTLVINGGTVTNSDPALSGAVNNALNNVTLNNGTLTSTTGSAALLDPPRVNETYGSWNINGTVTSDGNSFISTTANSNGQVMLSSTGGNTTFAVNSGTLLVTAPLMSGDVSAFSSGLVKTGPGTMVLTAVNTYTGVTTVSDGTLLIGGSISGSITNVTGGTLGGNGETGAINLSGGTLAPGLGSGVSELTTGSLTFTGGTFALDLNTTAKTSDLVTAMGDLSLSGGANLSLSIVNPSANPLAIGQVFTLIDYAGAWDGGAFAGYADNSTFTLGLDAFRISYDGVDDATHQVVLQVVVPEPSTAFSLIGGMGVLLGLRRRRK